jgi:beta-glucanase (GH16 family)
MKRLTVITILVLLILTTIFLLSHQPPESGNGWMLVWEDNFEGEKPDLNKWNVLLREHSKHNERQYYLPDEVFVENGILRIRSQERKYGSMEYTSGRLDTENKFAPVYGRFEIKGKLPSCQGIWPAYWLYPQERNWDMEYIMSEAVANGKEAMIPEKRPWYTEIDIMEFLGHEPDVLYGTLHYYTFDGQKRTSSGTWKGPVNYSDEFHIYALEWEPDSIRWYIDDQLLHATTSGIPHTPHYLIINTAIGGSWPGDPDSTTVFPQFHDIDYVRIYRRKSDPFDK